MHQKILSQSVQQVKVLLAKSRIIDSLKKSPWIKVTYYKLISNSKVNYDLYDAQYQEQIVGKKCIAFYSSYWAGVANSTQSFFKEDSMAFPLFANEHPEVNTHPYLERLVVLLSASQTLHCVVLSGGSLLQRELAKKIKQKNPKLKIYFAWHGSPAQWVERAHHDTFRAWVKLYEQSLLDGIISFKPDLDKVIRSLGVKAYSVTNFIINATQVNRLSKPTENEFKVGLFAANFSWYKNPYPQLLSVAAIPEGELVTNLSIEKDFDWMLRQIKINKIQSHLGNQQFIEVLASVHVVLYVTNTECSPMIALESVAVQTPCIVGPAGNIYKNYPELEHYLVEPEVDNPFAISQRLKLVRDNYSAIKEMLLGFKHSYNHDLNMMRDELYAQLIDNN